MSVLLKVARANGAGSFSGYFCGGIIANVIGNLTDEEFAEFNKPEPCGRTGCDCHLLFGDLRKALAELRADHREHCVKTITE